MNKIKIMATMLLMVVASQVAAGSIWDQQKQVLDKSVDIVVYRSPTCNCCSKWITHLKKHNFNVKDIIKSDMVSVKQRLNVPGSMASCHTAVVNGYVVEGHVPADDIKTLLTSKPAIHGVSVPAMPSGTPGMEMGGRKDPFNVLTFDKEGNVGLYHAYGEY